MAYNIEAKHILGASPGVPVVHWHQGEGVGAGLPHPVHQGGGRAARAGGDAAGAQKWTGNAILKREEAEHSIL